MHAGKPIYWHEGLFLRPQHFQQLDEYCQHTIQSRFQYEAPYQWGVKSLNILQSSVANEIIEIVDLELLFKDGTHIQYPGNCKISRRNIADLWDDSGKSMSIYLALKKKEVGKSNVRTEANCDNEYSLNEVEARRKFGNISNPVSNNLNHTRYMLSDNGVNIADQYSDDKYHNLLFLDYQIQIIVGAEIKNLENYHLVKIAELTKTAGNVRVSTEYIPALIHISSSKRMINLLQDNLAQIASTIRKLKTQYADSQIHQKLHDVNAFKSLLILQTLNRYFPLLQQSLIEPVSKPYDVYLYLQQLISELSTFSHINHAAETAHLHDGQAIKFRHDSLAEVFKFTFKKISLLLRELVSTPETILPLVYDGTYFSARIDSSEDYNSATIYLAISTKLVKEKIVHLIECLTKLSSRENLPLLISRSISSSDLEYQEEPDFRLEHRKGIYYFKLNKSGLVWETIKQDGNVAIYLNAPVEEIEMKLVALYD
ncbi:MAG: type VI secretion system baseplate subunit TssK [Thiohalomonadales bacterium]